jgi:ferredoxin
MSRGFYAACCPSGKTHWQQEAIMLVHLEAQAHPLLALLEQQKIPVETHCRSGYCGVCRKRLVRGQVTYPEQPLAYVEEGEALLCCAHPVSDVTVDI